MSDQKFLAGWNMPGCMPEKPFAEFDMFEEARAYIVQELALRRHMRASGELGAVRADVLRSARE